MAERYVALKPGTHTQVREVTGWLLWEKPQASSLRRVWVPGPGRALAGPEGSAGGRAPPGEGRWPPEPATHAAGPCPLSRHVEKKPVLCCGSSNVTSGWRLDD